MPQELAPSPANVEGLEQQLSDELRIASTGEVALIDIARETRLGSSCDEFWSSTQRFDQIDRTSDFLARGQRPVAPQRGHRLRLSAPRQGGREDACAGRGAPRPPRRRGPRAHSRDSGQAQPTGGAGAALSEKERTPQEQLARLCCEVVEAQEGRAASARAEARGGWRA